MKILSIYPAENMAFDCIITFIPNYSRSTQAEKDDINAICNWVSNTFSQNFVILESASRMIAGGAGDNASAWNRGYDPDHSTVINHWELRCYSKDATLFLLKYSDKERNDY